MEHLGVAPVRGQRHPGRRHPEPGDALFEDLLAFRGHHVGPGRQVPPQSELEPAVRAGVGPDGVVDQRPAAADHGRHHVLQGLAAVGHDDGRIQAGQGGPEPATTRPRAKPTPGVPRPRCAEREVGHHLGRSVEQAEQAVDGGRPGHRARRPGPGPRVGRRGPAVVGMTCRTRGGSAVLAAVIGTVVRSVIGRSSSRRAPCRCRPTRRRDPTSRTVPGLR